LFTLRAEIDTRKQYRAIKCTYIYALDITKEGM
jgi:hypothetical protein